MLEVGNSHRSFRRNYLQDLHFPIKNAPKKCLTFWGQSKTGFFCFNIRKRFPQKVRQQTSIFRPYRN